MLYSTKTYLNTVLILGRSILKILVTHVAYISKHKNSLICVRHGFYRKRSVISTFKSLKWHLPALPSLNIPEYTNEYATTFNFTSRTAEHEMYFFCKPWITLSLCCNFAILQVHFQFYVITTYNLVGLGQPLGQGQDRIMFQR